MRFMFKKRLLRQGCMYNPVFHGDWVTCMFKGSFHLIWCVEMVLDCLGCQGAIVGKDLTLWLSIGSECYECSINWMDH